MSQVSPNPTMKEKEPTPIKTETVSTEIPLNQEGFSEMPKDILRTNQRIPQKPLTAKQFRQKTERLHLKRQKDLPNRSTRKSHSRIFFVSYFR